MKSIIKTTLTLALLLPVAGCWSKKEEAPAAKAHAEEAIAPAHQKQEAGKCSHKGCTHDHGNKKHHDDVEVQDMDMDDMDNDMEVEDMDDMDEMQDLE